MQAMTGASMNRGMEGGAAVTYWSRDMQHRGVAGRQRQAAPAGNRKSG